MTFPISLLGTSDEAGNPYSGTISRLASPSVGLVVETPSSVENTFGNRKSVPLSGGPDGLKISFTSFDFISLWQFYPDFFMLSHWFFFMSCAVVNPV